MTGTIFNVITVLVGSALGLVLGARLAERYRGILMDGIGLITLLLGLQMALQTANALIVLVSLLLGGLVGEWMRLEDRLAGAGDFIKARMGRGGERFTEGFVAASILFCVGPMALLGAINDGLRGDYSLLAVKSVMDGISAMAFTSTMGIGVAFSAIVVLLYQGGVSLMAGYAEGVFSPALVAELTACGGLMVLGIGLRLLNLRQIRVGNYLPALAFVSLAMALLSRL